MEIFTKEELKEMEMMQKKAEEKRKQEAQQRQAKKKEERKDKTLGLLLIVFVGGLSAYMFAPVLVEIIKTIIK